MIWAGAPIHINQYLKPGTILLVDKNGPKPMIHVDSESTRAEFLKRCGISGIITNIGDLPK